MRSRFRTAWLPRLALLLLTGAAYCTSFDGPFIFDDWTVVNENPYMRSVWPPIEAMRWLPRSSTAGRPLIAYSFAINYAISEMEVWSYHAFNLLVHMVNVLLVYGLLRLTLTNPAVPAAWRSRATAVSFFLAAIWAVHPLNSETVIYITQRTVLLSAMFMLLSLRLLIAAHHSSRPMAWKWLTVFAIVLGVLCKEKVAVMPILLLLYDRTFLAGSFAEAWRRRRGMYLGLAGTWLLSYGAIAYVERGGIGDEAHLGWRYLLTQGWVICRYVWQVVFPYPLAITYHEPLARGITDSLPWSVLVLAGLIVTCWALVRRPVWGFVGAWFYLILSPDSSVVPILTEVVAERRMYLPMLSVMVVLVALAAMVGRWVGSWLARPAEAVWPVLTGTALAAVVAYTGATLVRANDYDSDLLIWEQTLRAQPNSSMAMNNLIVRMIREGRIEEAQRILEDLEEQDTNYFKGPILWGQIYAARGEMDNALIAMREAVNREPDDPGVLASMAMIQLAADDLDGAQETLRHGLEIAPQSVKLLLHHATLLEKRGMHAEAIAVLEYLLEYEPDDAANMMNMAVSLDGLGRTDEARQWFERAREELSTSAHLLRNYADFEAKHRNFDRAEDLYRAAIEEDDRNVEAAVGLAMVYRELRRYDEAEDIYRSALQVDPTDHILRNNYGVLLATMGRLPEAGEQFQRAVMLKPDYPDAVNNLQKLQAALSESSTQPPSPGPDPGSAEVPLEETDAPPTMEPARP